MFKVLFPAVFVLSVLLSACGGDSTPAVADLALTGSASVVVGAPNKVQAVLRDGGGNVIAGTVTYTSDQPNVIAVDGQGNLTVKRLSATGKPVVVTASVGNQRDTLNIATYGLELAVGNYVWNTQPAGAAPGRFIAVRYRPESGATQASAFTVTAPSTESLNCTLSLNDVNGWCWWSLPDATKYPAGEYRASLIQGGVTYSATALVSPSEGALAFVDGARATVDSRDMTFSGSLPAASRWVYSYVASSRAENQTSSDVVASTYSTALPTTLKVGPQKQPRTYDTWITVMSGNLGSFAEVLPEQFNVSATFAGQVALQ